MNLEQIITNCLNNTDQFQQTYLGENEIDLLSAELLAAIEPQLRIIVEMRYAQRAYFRRRIEDNLSRAKKLENMVDELLLPIDTKRQIIIQPDVLIF